MAANISSADILSTPGAFRCFIFLIAAVTSSSVIVGASSLVFRSGYHHPLRTHKYADDNQLFISFVISEYSPTFHTCKPQWLSANLLSKTEFLVIGLPDQLLKISDPCLLMLSNAIISPTSSARNLGVIFESSLSMSDHISSVLTLVSYPSVTSAE